MKRTGVLIVALAFLAAGCGRFGSSDDASSTDTTAPGDVGVGLDVPSTQPRVTQPAPTTIAVADPCKTKPTSSTATRDNRVKIVLSVTGACFKLSDDFNLTMVVTNTSSAPINYDANQTNFFTIRAPAGEQRRRWEDDDCVPPTGNGQKTALTLAPGASVTFTAMYPAAKNVAQRESCRRLETGAYDVHGTFLVCDESFQDGYCDIAKDTQYRADPVGITVS